MDQRWVAMICVRRLQPEQWRLLRDVRLAALSDSPAAFSKPLVRAQSLTDADWQRLAHDGAGGEISSCYLALVEDVPVGIAVGLPDAEDASRAYLVSMWVAPSHRGGRTAVALLDEVERWAAARGARTLVAGVTAGNDRALAFYRKCGYEPAACGSQAAIAGCDVVLAKVLG
jgi:GNAT superfamily N-acetyltransferase